MKRNILVFFLSLILVGGMLRAQSPMAVPNGSFEQWSNHSGYSVTAMYVINIPVYDAYSTPSVWNYPLYPVNQTVSVLSYNVHINTNVPIIKASQETTGVPDGSKAVKLQTFMLSDIINPTVLNVASSSLDPSLTSQVIPSILSTGAVNIESFIPLMTSMMSGTGEMFSMLPTLLNEDINDYITGGLPMGDFRPAQLTGSYKFHSATSGDNGGVILLGTHYNNVTHKRQIVGGGINLDLVDANTYTPFAVDYLPLGGLMPGVPDVDPDTLVVLLISSASTNRQQGSYLCLDNLVLWSQPDTCASITSLSAVPDIHEAQVTWSVTDPADGFEIEYGPVGFIQGNGAPLTAINSSLSLTGLEAGTTYDVYVRTLCSDSIYGEWRGIQFTTLDDTCASVLDMWLSNQVVDEFPQLVLEWNGSSQPLGWQVEYGPHGFGHGDGTLVETTDARLAIYELENAGVLAPNTWYDFYVRSMCVDSIYGVWDSIHYRTFCSRIGALTVNADSLTVTADSLVSGYILSWIDTSDNSNWQLIYADPETEQYEIIFEPYFAFPPLKQGTTYTVSVTPFCGEHNYGMETTTTFTTAIIEIHDTVTPPPPVAIQEVNQTDKQAIFISPNPAKGQCSVTVADGMRASLKLYTADGRLVETVATDGAPVMLELPWRGVFLLRATTASGTTSYKIISR